MCVETSAIDVYNIFGGLCKTIILVTINMLSLILFLKDINTFDVIKFNMVSIPTFC